MYVKNSPEKDDKNFITLALFIIIVLVSIIPPNFREELAFLCESISVWIAITVILISIITYLYKKVFSVFIPSLFFFIVYFLKPLINVQKNFLKLDFTGVNYLIPLLLYIIIILSRKELRIRVNWLNIGKLRRNIVYLIIFLIILSIIALFLWYYLLTPDIDKFKGQIPDWGIYFLISGGIGFALINSIVEELIFRGIIWDGLKNIQLNTISIIILQSVIFGLWHFHGFPGGFIGSTMVFLWGIILGIIRNQSGGMLGPIIAHIFADLTIFVILILY